MDNLKEKFERKNVSYNLRSQPDFVIPQVKTVYEGSNSFSILWTYYMEINTNGYIPTLIPIVTHLLFLKVILDSGHPMLVLLEYARILYLRQVYRNRLTSSSSSSPKKQ